MTEHLRMTACCVYLWILRSFSENFFCRAPVGNWLFQVQVAEFQTVANYFTCAFQALYARARSSNSKEFIYLKSLKTIWLFVKKLICIEAARWQPANLPKKNSFTHHTASFMYFAFILSECIRITSSGEALKVC